MQFEALVETLEEQKQDATIGSDADALTFKSLSRTTIQKINSKVHMDLRRAVVSQYLQGTTVDLQLPRKYALSVIKIEGDKKIIFALEGFVQ